MEENLFGNFEKNPHQSLHEYGEAACREKRVVFMGEEGEPTAGESEGAEAPVEGASTEPLAVEGSDGRSQAEAFFRSFMDSDEKRAQHQINVTRFASADLKKPLDSKFSEWLNGRRETLSPKPTETEMWDVFFGDALKEAAKKILVDADETLAADMIVKEVEVENGRVTRIHAYHPESKVALIYKPDTNADFIKKGLESAHNPNLPELTPIEGMDLGVIDLTAIPPTMKLDISLSGVGKEGVGIVESIHLAIDLAPLGPVKGEVKGISGAESVPGTAISRDLQSSLQQGFQQVVDNNLRGKQPKEVNIALLGVIKDGCNAKFEEIMASAIDEAASGDSEAAGEAAPAKGEETPLVVNLGELLVAGGLRGIDKDNLTNGEKIIVPIGRERVEVTVHKEGERISFTCNLPFFEGVRIPFEIKEDGTAVMTFGGRKVTLRFENSTVIMEGLGKKGEDRLEVEMEFITSGASPYTIDMKFRLNGMPIGEGNKFNFVTLFGGEDNLRQAGFSPEQIEDMRSMPLAPSAGMDEESETSADGAEDAVTEGAAAGAAEGGDTDQDQDRKGRSALERTFGREASENIGSFMETLEELAAVVLELLESLGFDLNPDKNKDGTTRTPAEREGRRLWLFIGRNQLGTKNRGKLQSMKMDELMALHHDKDQARTVAALEEAEFDVKGVHGEKLYEMLEHIHNIKDKDDRNKEDGKGAEKVKEYYEANGNRMNLNTFLFKTKMIDMNGRWSDGWEEFTGQTDEEIAAEQAAAAAAEATRTQERTDLKNNTTLKPEVMKRIVNADESDERNALAKKLQDMKVLTDPAAIAKYDASDKTPDDFRTLLLTMTPGHKEEFFGGDPAVEKGWRDVMKDVKTRLDKISAGETPADELAEYLTKLDTKFEVGGKSMKFSGKTKLTAALKKPVVSYDDKRFIENGADKVDTALAKDNFGIRGDEVETLFKYLHEPEGGNYTGEKVTLGKVYSLQAGSPYTLADLMVAVFDIKLGEEAPAAEPAP